MGLNPRVPLPICWERFARQDVDSYKLWVSATDMNLPRVGFMGEGETDLGLSAGHPSCCGPIKWFRHSRRHMIGKLQHKRKIKLVFRLDLVGTR